VLVTFKGPGCDNCPFYHMKWHNGEQWNECTVHKYTDEVDQLFPIGRERPKDCPFKGFPGNLEIQAMD
jgi:hypothetical protein